MDIMEENGQLKKSMYNVEIVDNGLLIFNTLSKQLILLEGRLKEDYLG